MVGAVAGACVRWFGLARCPSGMTGANAGEAASIVTAPACWVHQALAAAACRQHSGSTGQPVRGSGEGCSWVLTCLARSSSSLIWLLTSTPFSSATCRTCSSSSGSASRVGEPARASSGGGGGACGRVFRAPLPAACSPPAPPCRTSLMRLSSSTRGFSKSSTVVLEALSLTGPNRDRMDCSHSRPPAR